ncbi:MAG: MerR family DNA-binding protein [Candidatus Acidiferrum sp.]
MATNHQTENPAMQIGAIAKRTSLTVKRDPILREAQALAQGGSKQRSVPTVRRGIIEQLHFIQQMHGLGFSLREFGELFQLRERKVDACESVKGLLKAKLTEVRAKLQELRRLESELEMHLRKCSRELSHRRWHAAHACRVLEEAAGVSQ